MDIQGQSNWQELLIDKQSKQMKKKSEETETI